MLVNCQRKGYTTYWPPAVADYYLRNLRRQLALHALFQRYWWVLPLALAAASLALQAQYP